MNREHAEQVKIFSWAKWKKNQYPELALMYAIPNATKIQQGLANGVYKLILCLLYVVLWFTPVIKYVRQRVKKLFNKLKPDIDRLEDKYNDRY